MRVYLLGDSHSQALIPRITAALPEVEVYGQAFPGYNTARATQAMRPPASADLVVIALGGNDFGNRAAERAELVSRLSSVGPIVWFGPAHASNNEVDARHKQQTNAQSAQLPQLGVTYYDSRPWTTANHAADGVHFTGTGYDNWASRIAGVIRSTAAAGGGGGAAGLLLVALAVGGYLWWRSR